MQSIAPHRICRRASVSPDRSTYISWASCTHAALCICSARSPPRIVSRRYRAMQCSAHGEGRDSVDYPLETSESEKKSRVDTAAAGDLAPDSADPMTPAAQTPFGIPGQVVILCVALLWGSNPPALRYLYATDGPPTPAAFAGVQATAAAALLLVLNAALQRWQPGRHSARDYDRLAAEGEEAEAAAESGQRGTLRRRRHGSEVSSITSVKTALNATTERVWLAGAEIGLWGFLANACTVTGFQNTAASRGAFLIRLSAILTPLVASLAGESVNAAVWAGCLAALCGSVLMGLGHSGSDPGAAAGGIAVGDALLVAAALLWSVQTVRLGKHARRFPPLALAAASMCTMAAASDAWLAADVGQAVLAGRPADSVWPGFRVPLNWAVMLWPAVGPWGIGQALQVAGQSAISSSQTQILMASDPLWATAFSYLPFLSSQEHDLGTYGVAGGLCIVAGAVLAGAGGGSRPQRERGDDDE